MSENQYVDKKTRQQHNHKTSPFDLQPLEWILNLEDNPHSLQHVKTEVRNCVIFGDLSTVTSKYWRLWRPASALKIHSKVCKSNAKSYGQMMSLYDYATVLFSYTHIAFLTF